MSSSASSPSSLDHEFIGHVGDRRNRSGAPPSPAPGSTSGPEGQSKAEVRHAFVDQRSPKVKGVPGTAEGQWSCHVAVPRPLKRAAAHQLPRRSVTSGLTSNFSLASWRRPHPRETGGASMRVPWWLAGCMAAALVLGGCSSTAKSGSPTTTTAVRSTTTTAAAPKPPVHQRVPAGRRNQYRRRRPRCHRVRPPRPPHRRPRRAQRRLPPLHRAIHPLRSRLVSPRGSSASTQPVCGAPPSRDRRERSRARKTRSGTGHRPEVPPALCQHRPTDSLTGHLVRRLFVPLVRPANTPWCPVVAHRSHVGPWVTRHRWALKCGR